MNELAIFIPTYNRPDSIREFLEKCIVDLLQYKIKIVIADSSDNTDTKIVIDQFEDTEIIEYYRYDSTITPDEKIHLAFSEELKKYKYVWLCGDTCILKTDLILSTIMELCNKEYDIIHLDDIDYYNIGNKVYADPKLFFKECFWRITLFGATIISSRVFKYLQSIETYEKYAGTFFFYQCSLMEFCSKEKFKSIHIHIDFKSTYSKKKGSVWSGYTIKQFCELWYLAIENLPPLYDGEKEDVLKSHSKIYGLFKFKNLLVLRERGALTIETVFHNRMYISKTVNKSLIIFYMVAIIPRRFIRVIIDIYIKTKSFRKK